MSMASWRQSRYAPSVNDINIPKWPAIFWIADRKPRISGDAISLMYTCKSEAQPLFYLEIIYWFFFVSKLHTTQKLINTCVTSDTIEQQNPPMNAVANMVSTDFANTVKIHDKENGNDIIVNNLRRPYFKKNPPKRPPNRAPVHTTKHAKRNEGSNNNNKIGQNEKMKLSFWLKLLLCLNLSTAQRRRERERKNEWKNELSTVIILVSGNNIKRTTSSAQSAYKTETCSCRPFFARYSFKR